MGQVQGGQNRCHCEEVVGPQEAKELSLYDYHDLCKLGDGKYIEQNESSPW